MKMIHIAKLFAEDRDVFEKNHRLFVGLPNLEKEIKLILLLIQQYYDAYPEHKYIGPIELQNFYDLQYPNSRDKIDYHEMALAMHEAKVSTSITKDLMEQGIEMAFAQQIVTKLLPVMQGNKFGVLSTIKENIEAFHAHLRHPPRETSLVESSSLSPSELVHSAANPEGPPWAVHTLNMIIGPAQLKTLGTFFGFVDSGKTSFILSNLVSFANYYKESSEMVCFAGNEEASRRVHERLLGSFFSKNKEELQGEDQQQLDADAMAAGFNRIKVFDQIGHITQIRKILDDWGPKVLIVDQGSKVMHDVKCKETDTIRVLYNFYRDLSVEYDCCVITIEQGVGESENRQWLKLSDIYNSRVGLQGELDYAVGIGKVIELKGRENIRYFHISKNKLLNGDKAKFAMTFDHERCLWKMI